MNNFGEVIFSYTRKQAIEDGVLVELNTVSLGLDALCKEHYKLPICFTAKLWANIQKAIENKKYMNDLEGVVHDILYMSRTLKVNLSPSSVMFTVIILGAGRKQNHCLELHVHGDDNALPVITVGYSEDF